MERTTLAASDSPSSALKPLLIMTPKPSHASAPLSRRVVEFENLNQISEESQECFQIGQGLGLRARRNRLTQPRMSLLGKPLSLRASRRDAKYRRLQSRIYNFLERPRGYDIIYHILVFLMVFTCLTLSVFSTIDVYEEISVHILTYMESFVVIWFTIEFGLRLWSSGCRSRYQGITGRLKFMRSPFCVVDIVTIIASIVVLVMRSRGHLAATALRGLRFFQILRMVRMDRRGGTWKLLGSVVYAHRQELITTLYIGFLGLIFASFLVFLAEKDVNKKFSNFAQALWWGVVTLCTVGYGDMVPETWQGKMIASFCALLGISFFALPAGILGSGFALKVQQQQRQKHMIRRRQPAAMLIQSIWRCYAADEESLSIATWKIHEVRAPSPTPTKFQEVSEKTQSSISTVVRVSASLKYNTSFVSRLPTIRRKTTSLHSPSLQKSHPSKSMKTSIDSNSLSVQTDANAINMETKRILINEPSEDSMAETTIMIKRNSDVDEEEIHGCVQLTRQHKAAIRAIRKLKYLVARKKFREALKPYDVKDVIEQYSSGHADLLNRVKNLHFRLDMILGVQGSHAKDVYASKISLSSRIVKIERQVEDIEAKIDQFVDLYMVDRNNLLGLTGDNKPEQEPPNSSNPSTPPATQTTNTTTTTTTTSSSSVDLPDKSIESILVKKQYSEPSSPNKKRYKEHTGRPGGISDLSNRFPPKKRVTMSSILKTNAQRSAPEDIVIIVPSTPFQHASTSNHSQNFTSNSSREEMPGSAQSEFNLTNIGNKAMNDSGGNSQDFGVSKESSEDEETTLLCSSPTEILISPLTLGR